ncbi:hypothetical protein DTO164E3_3566 [Paecilomyces variotii]|nr:hypothetical protein DTO164E3_3566 [Paecilomyces variotii]KAJ9352713.1 hypothetical protein DTO027B9_5721 [Paecilomyces variotii]
MAAATLPIEIIQSILLSAEPEAYHSARLACNSWRHAASSSFMLQEALKKTPTPLPSPEDMTEDDWNTLFNQIAHLNLLDRRDHIEKTVIEQKRPPKCTFSTVVAVSGDRSKLAAMHGSRVVVYNINNETHDLEFGLARSLYPLWTTMSRTLADGMRSWMTMGQHYAKYHIALSTHGNLIAVALGKSIHIYDLQNPSSLDSPAEGVIGDNETVSVAAGVTGYEEAKGVVESLEFVENDSLLRVVIGKEPNANRQTRVRYLGKPPPRWGSSRSCSAVTESLEYWNENINHIYLDSVALAVSFRDDNKTAFQAVQLVPESVCEGWTDQPGRFFIAALQNTGINGYCIAFVSNVDNKVTIWRQLPSRTDRISDRWAKFFEPIPQEKKLSLAVSDAMVVARNRQVAKDRWNPVNMPYVTSTHPMAAISDDGKILVVFEPGAGHSYSFSNGGALYVYSMQWCDPEFRPRQCTSGDKRSSPQQQPFSIDGVSPSIQPWSFLLDIINVDIDRLRVEEREQREGAGKVYLVRAETAHEVMEWRLA